MQNWKRFPRIILFLTLLISLLAGLFAPTLENQSASAAPLSATALDVFISEVAWAGTSGTYFSDEWIELYNNTNSTINLSGWTLVSDDGDPNITLTGNSIPAYGYYLLESGDDSTIFNITADQIYSGSLGNTAGEILTLRDDLTNIIDTANS